MTQKKEMTERQKKALELKGNHRIFMFRDKLYADAIREDSEEVDSEIENDFLRVYDIADADEMNFSEEQAKELKEDPSNLLIPDFTPDWLREVIDCFDGVYEEMESLFNFPDDETIKEFKKISDFVIDEE